MTALGWFLLGFVAGFAVAITVWVVKLGKLFMEAVKHSEEIDKRVVEEVLRRHRDRVRS